MIRTGQDLTWARMMLGISQDGLARRLRLRKAGAHYIRDMESGRAPVSGPVAVAVEQFLVEAGIPDPAGFRDSTEGTTS